MLQSQSLLRRSSAATAVALGILVSSLPALLPAVGLPTTPAASAALTTTPALRLLNARTVDYQASDADDLLAGAPVPAGTTYTWMINKEDVGDPDSPMAPSGPCTPPSNGGDASYPDNCPWPSVRSAPGWVPIAAQGDQDDWNATTAPDFTAIAGAPDLGPGRYLVSVQADGYKVGGGHFTVNANGTVDGPVTASLQPWPLPLGNIRVKVFADEAPVDGVWEAGAENGLANFTAQLQDVLGQVTTDWFGNPLCTQYEHGADPDGAGPLSAPMLYDADGSPIVDTTAPASCRSDSQGDILIPNLGPNRYGVTVSPPSSSWGQTTTLEGAKDFDVWVQEGDTGYDTELVVGGEPVSQVQFGFVRANVDALASAGAPGATGVGSVTGTVRKGYTYIGGSGGVVVPGEPGTSGMKAGPPISRPWVTLSDQSNGDAMVYSTRGSTNGTFDISGVPAGTYFLTVWDEPIDHLLYSFAVTVSGGQQTDVGDVLLAGWFTEIDGYVYVDTNGNGVKDAGEQGIPGTTVTLRERDNTLMDQFTNTVTTNDQGYYSIKEAYPLTRWLVLEHFNTRFEGTGIAVQAENDPQPTVFLGPAVDVSVLPVIGLAGQVDWGVKPYANGTNGGIAGTVNYDTMRNELNPRDSVAEDYQPGIPNIPVHLYGVQLDTDPSSPDYGQPLLDSRGLPLKGPELATTYTSETFAPAKGCTARDWSGAPLTDQKALPEFGLVAAKTCVEASMTGWTARPSEYDTATATDSSAEAWGQTVAGNYGFAESDLNLYLPDDPNAPACAAGNEANCTNGRLNLFADLAQNGSDPQPLATGDYIVGVGIPDDVYGNPMYRSSQEEDINVFEGDAFLPQENFPPVGTAATGGGGTTTPAAEPPAPPSQTPGTTFDCVGPDHTVDSSANPTFVDGNGGSPFEGQAKPLCTERLVTLRGQQAMAPTFLLFTPTPLPTHFWGLMINDLGLTWDKSSTTYGEAQGIPHAPVGLYDFAGQLVDTVHTDYNGYYEALEPSTHNYNCPTPSGVCAGMYRFVGNDPGQPGAPNADYNPRYRTIAANFQAFPGVFDVTDTAPTSVATTILTPGSAIPTPVSCDVSTVTPQLLSVNDPVAESTATGLARRLVLNGRDFKAVSDDLGSGSRVELLRADRSVAYAWTRNGTDAWPNFASWNDTVVQVDLPVPDSDSGTLTPEPGAYQLRIRNRNNVWTVNGITVHLLGAGYEPGVVTVDSSDAPAAGTPNSVQAGIDAASAGDIVLVRPGATGAFNPRGWYLENVVLDKEVQVQGVGPGGRRANGTWVAGSGIDARTFDPDAAVETWYDRVFGTDGYPEATVPDGAAVTVLGEGATDQAGDDFAAQPGTARFDGFTVTGGFQLNFQGNINAVTGAVSTPFGADGARVSQGGGLYVHTGAEGFQVGNNIVIGNGGSYAGGLRVGTPYVAGGSHNEGLRVVHNRFRDNGGTNLAGGVAFFSGSDGYEFAHNDVCGNFSQEYGGGLTHYGYSPNASLHDNRVWFNTSYDEGGGIMVAGELTNDPAVFGEGSGNVSIEANQIKLNLSNDDGGGLRLLMVGWNDVDVVNNAITNNVSAHEGGGIALDDAPSVTVVNNTVARNLTTATAITSNGEPAPAGLSTSWLSQPLLDIAPPDYDGPGFSKPVLRNNAFWDNRAGWYDSTGVHGISFTDANRWDMGSIDGSGPLSPRTGTMSRLRFTSTTVHQPTWYSGTCPNCFMPGTDVRRPGAGNSGQGLDAASGIFVTQVTGANNGGGHVRFVRAIEVGVDIQYNRTFPAFRQILLVAQNLPPDSNLQGNYHINGGSQLEDRGRAGWLDLPDVLAPELDLDGQVRWSALLVPDPTIEPVDAGFDERP